MSYEQQILAELTEIRTELILMKKQMDHYKGFVGGILWAASALVTAAVSFYLLLKGQFAPSHH